MGYNGTIRLSDRHGRGSFQPAQVPRKARQRRLTGRENRQIVSNASLVLGQVSVNPISVSVGEKLPGTSDGLLA